MAQTFMLYPFGADIPVLESFPEDSEILVNDDGEMKQVPVSALPSPSGGGGLVVETTFTNVSEYVKGFTSDLDADDIVEAFTSGQNVIVHFPTDESGYTSMTEQYVSVVAYVPADAEHYVAESIEFANSYPGLISISWYNQLSRTEQGKFFFHIYID